MHSWEWRTVVTEACLPAAVPLAVCVLTHAAFGLMLGPFWPVLLPTAATDLAEVAAASWRLQERV